MFTGFDTGVECALNQKKTVADLGDLPLGQKFFIFMQLSGKIGQTVGWRPLRVAVPSQKS